MSPEVLREAAQALVDWLEPDVVDDQDPGHPGMRTITRHSPIVGALRIALGGADHSEEDVRYCLHGVRDTEQCDECGTGFIVRSDSNPASR